MLPLSQDLEVEPATLAITQEHHLLSRDSNLDPLEIENISIRNQSEWELWGALVRDFGDRNRHSAYLSFLSRNLCFDKGAARYREHRKQFIGSKTDFWQAEIADEMLEKIQKLCWVQLERTLGARALKPGQVLAASEYRGVLSRVPWGLWLALALVLVGAAVANIR